MTKIVGVCNPKTTQESDMDALSRLLMLNAPQGTIDKNCVLGSDWQLPHGAGELSVIRWHALTQGAAKLEMPTGET
ncbi:hypothetical protein EIMP300_76740 [Escherichia coli]|uniref:Uncharacterized protein n=1 Tax=Escherichia coli TaxID=562 RepID=A0A8S0G0S0_ECOLX|nr:hypothetical protein EIMP300_76740 [Escherichia coli]